MSIKSKILSAAAVTALAVAPAAVTVTAASAATPSCGASCIDVFSHQFGTHHNPAFVLDVFHQGSKVGQPLILFRQSNSDPAEDFTFAEEGLVSDFYAAGLASSAVALHYGGLGCTVAVHPCPAGRSYPDLEAFEVEYAPYGVESGLCVGLASTAASGEKVTLQPCGVTARTTWVVDSLDHDPSTSDYPAVNGSDTNFSHPLVLTYPAGAFPADIPRPQLSVTNLTGFSGSLGIPVVGTVNSGQVWSANLGVLK